MAPRRGPATPAVGSLAAGADPPGHAPNARVTYPQQRIACAVGGDTVVHGCYGEQRTGRTCPPDGPERRRAGRENPPQGRN
jgi:hypothetical protein